jgi:hypothetical protein
MIRRTNRNTAVFMQSDGNLGRTEAADILPAPIEELQSINDKGGVNGRNFMAMDSKSSRQNGGLGLHLTS